MVAISTPCHPERVPAPVRSVRLRVIGGSIELRDDVPKTRSECPKGGPCGHIRCEWHLWRVDGPDQPGKPRSGVGKEFGSEARPTDLRPVWLEWPLPPSCFLDALETAKREGWFLEQMATAFGVSYGGMKYLLAKTMIKVKRAGVSLAEFVDTSVPHHGTVNER